MTAIDTRYWVAVCRYADVRPGRAVAVLLGGRQVAVVRTNDGDVFAVGNRDPETGASVISRGIVGTRGECPTIITPMYKHVFDLRTGRSFDDPALALPVYDVRVTNPVGQGAIVEIATG